MTNVSGKKNIQLVLSKRQKFVVGVIFLSISLFAAEGIFSRYGLYASIILSIVTDLFLWWGIRKDIKDNFMWAVFLLPFFYSLSFGLFFFLLPARILTRMILTLVYGFGLYFLFLCQNIFIVASIRTIALLSGARIVSMVVALLSYVFLTNTMYSFHLWLPYRALILGLYSFFLVLGSLWTITLEKSVRPILGFTIALTISLVQVSIVLWFWPTNPTVAAIFQTGIFYTTVGLSQVWLSKRLFRGVMWEYIWVGVVVFLMLLLFTSWTD